MRTTSSVLATLTTTAVAISVVTAPAPAQAADGPAIVVAAGVTQPVFGYTDAIRERVWVDTDVDSDRDGVDDVIRVDIMRPAATEQGLDVPVIIDDSPYYTTLCRGNEGECKADVDGDGLLDRWPLFYDNYFVPRGYAVALVDMTGTAGSTGCPTIQGANENLSGPAVIDWLNGRRTARDADGDEIEVDWHNGKSAMVGKSYDGALAMAGAVSGVDGLETVVPIAGPYNYYDYTRSNGIVMRGGNYLRSLADAITDDDPTRQERCDPVWDDIDANDGDETGDYSPFWDERNYLDDAANIEASVFLVHGIQEENVRADHFGKFWRELEELDIDRKLWVSRTGHIEPFDYRRAEWVATLHRWLDHWLHGIKNGIMREPAVDVETKVGVWEQYADWPVPGTTNVNVWLRAGDEGAGSFALTPGQGERAESFVDDPFQRESAMVDNPDQPTPSRLVYLSEPLERDLRVSGTPVVHLSASSSLDEAYFGAILVEYGPSTQNDRDGDGIRQTDLPEECYGEASQYDDGCYRPVEYRPIDVTQWRVTKGILDGQNRNSITTPEPMVPGEMHEIGFPLLPSEHVFLEGNRIGIVLVGSYRSYRAERIFSRPTITVDTKVSRIALPVLGGRDAAIGAGIPLR